ncbi:hypothetical protein GGTG_10831 [Gaeumannomyces tritici R3-111a-1]|uniref:Uncharacterized protein n=1 Tax=Gaeumannomyces tritici (strain R3-111a-1) TaxID=644352 RepID=J3PBF8_GAET3|nr:hypothetical protein GGTG_10831 [Gaeumannomyces tritici R3-111a-1]EJT71575.1 hypothetical protein GGTG_10831 [Gaeumannomyces tritici R3-111a-1]
MSVLSYIIIALTRKGKHSIPTSSLPFIAAYLCVDLPAATYGFVFFWREGIPKWYKAALLTALSLLRFILSLFVAQILAGKSLVATEPRGAAFIPFDPAILHSLSSADLLWWLCVVILVLWRVPAHSAPIDTHRQPVARQSRSLWKPSSSPTTVPLAPVRREEGELAMIFARQFPRAQPDEGNSQDLPESHEENGSRPTPEAATEQNPSYHTVPRLNPWVRYWVKKGQRMIWFIRMGQRTLPLNGVLLVMLGVASSPNPNPSRQDTGPYAARFPLCSGSHQ